jgi:hypothetical protein
VRWNRIVPIANWEASTSSSNGLSWSGQLRAMSFSMSLISVETAFLCASPQVNLAFFFSRSVRGRVTSAKLGMNGLW